MRYITCATSPYKYVNPLGNKFLTVPLFLQRQHFLRLCDNFKTRSLPLISFARQDRYLDVLYFQGIIENVSKTKTYHRSFIFIRQWISLETQILKFNSFVEIVVLLLSKHFRRTFCTKSALSSIFIFLRIIESCIINIEISIFNLFLCKCFIEICSIEFVWRKEFCQLNLLQDLFSIAYLMGFVKVVHTQRLYEIY